MNFLTLQVSDSVSPKTRGFESKVFGGAITLVGGSLDGQLFSSGSAVFIIGDMVRFEERARKSQSIHRHLPFKEDSHTHQRYRKGGLEDQNNEEDSTSQLCAGFWVLHRTVLRGFPAVICSFFNKRTQMMEQRYHKIFYKPGIYRCGPRFPKKLPPNRNQDDRRIGELEKLAA